MLLARRPMILLTTHFCALPFSFVPETHERSAAVQSFRQPVPLQDRLPARHPRPRGSDHTNVRPQNSEFDARARDAQFIRAMPTPTDSSHPFAFEMNQGQSILNRSLIDSRSLVVTLPPATAIDVTTRRQIPFTFPGTTIGGRLLDPSSGSILSESTCVGVPCH